MVLQYILDSHKVLLLTLIMVLITGSSYAQQTLADTLELQEVEIVATRIYQPLTYQPTNIEVIDSARLGLLVNQDIGQILASESSLFIKDNGPGSFSNASQRGLSPEQIQILWEGIPINNVMLGQTDLSLLPVNFFSNIQVSSGTPSTAFGGGGLSGALYLSSDWDANRKNLLSLRQGVGSFGQWQTSLDGQYQRGDWQITIRSLADYAKNDFSYYNRAYGREEQRIHNLTKQQNIMASVGHKSGFKKLNSTVWVSNSNNQIPGSILSTNSEAKQEDHALRWLTTYDTRLGNIRMSAKNYLVRTELNYFDPKSDIKSLSTTYQWLASTNFTSVISNNIRLKGELSGGLTGVETNNYKSDKTRRQISVLANPEITLSDHRLRIYPAVRLDAYNDFGTVLSPSLGINYELLPSLLFIRGQLSKNFDPPSMNALYWGEGGNTDLNPERSNNAEAGFTFTPHVIGEVSSFRITGFYNQVNNGIYWYPDKNGVYTPSNVEQVFTKGLEAQLKNLVNVGSEIQLELQQSLSLTRSEITEPRFQGDAAIGNQMRYVPKWKYHASLSIRKGIIQGLLQYRWIGRRYITDTEDVSNSLDPYQVLDATLKLQQEYHDFHFDVQAGTKNLLNTNYEVVQWYAMPQRNFNVSLTITYQL